MNQITYHQAEEVQYDEYIEFLTRTNLGSQYPKERFAERVTKMLLNRAVSITARNGQGLLVGVCFGQTDFSYFLFLTDLGVDREYEKKGIGKAMVNRCIDLAGGKDDITVVTLSSEQAIDFYKSIEFEQSKSLLWRDCNVCTDFCVS